MKIVGVLLMLFGSIWLAVTDIRSRRKRLAQVGELAAALSEMEALVRWKRQTLPKVMVQQMKRPLTGGYFAAALEKLHSGCTVQQAWQTVFTSFQPEIAGECVRQIELSGEETQLLGNLHMGSERLRQIYREMQQKRQEEEKLRLALLFSGCGMLIILLI